MPIFMYITVFMLQALLLHRSTCGHLSAGSASRHCDSSKENDCGHPSSSSAWISSSLTTKNNCAAETGHELMRHTNLSTILRHIHACTWAQGILENKVYIRTHTPWTHKCIQNRWGNNKTAPMMKKKKQHRAPQHGPREPEQGNYDEFETI